MSWEIMDSWPKTGRPGGLTWLSKGLEPHHLENIWSTRYVFHPINQEVWQISSSHLPPYTPFSSSCHCLLTSGFFQSLLAYPFFQACSSLFIPGPQPLQVRGLAEMQIRPCQPAICLFPWLSNLSGWIPNSLTRPAKPLFSLPLSLHYMQLHVLTPLDHLRDMFLSGTQVVLGSAESWP